MDDFDFRPKTVDAGIYKSVVEDNKYQIPDVLGDEDVCLDIGAHIGTFAYSCLQRGAGRVLAFDSDLENYKRMCEHLSSYADRVECFYAAVARSDMPDLYSMYHTVCDREYNTGGHHVRDDFGTPVTAVALDAVLRDIETCRILKLDVEGSEYPILYTSQELHRIQFLVGEFHTFDKNNMSTSMRVSGRTYKPEPLMDFLKDEGFKVNYQEHKARGMFFAQQLRTSGRKVKRPQRAGKMPPRGRKVPKEAKQPVKPAKSSGKTKARPANEIIVQEAKTFAWSSPYGGFWAEKFYRECGGKGRDIYKQKIKNIKHAHDLRSKFGALPELMMMGNFINDRDKIKQFFLDNNVDLVFGEDGFFPHYQTMHIDPIGFCWESSIPTLEFKECSDHQRARARETRSNILGAKKRTLPAGIKKPYVIWPLQLIGDRVNKQSLNLANWNPILNHFREILPEEVQLVVKPHPRGAGVKHEAKAVDKMQNAILLPKKGPDMHTLMLGACGAAGANSTVLTEARIMYNKPVWAYAPSWYTNHDELVYVASRKHKELSNLEVLDDNDLLKTDELNDYRDWYLYQLMLRQYDQRLASKDKPAFIKWVNKFTYKSYKEHGEDLFK